MLQALRFILETLANLYQVVLLLRLLMQLTRADFRNPIGRAIVQLTDPLVRPLRRVLPPVGMVDTASVLALLLFGAIKLWVLYLLFAQGVYPPLALLRDTALDLIHLVLGAYLIFILLNALLSFVAPGNYSPAQSLLASICNPVLDPFRRVIPSVGGLDLSPLWACIAIQALRMIIS